MIEATTSRQRAALRQSACGRKAAKDTRRWCQHETSRELTALAASSPSPSSFQRRQRERETERERERESPCPVPRQCSTSSTTFKHLSVFRLPRVMRVRSVESRFSGREPVSDPDYKPQNGRNRVLVGHRPPPSPRNKPCCAPVPPQVLSCTQTPPLS